MRPSAALWPDLDPSFKFPPLSADLEVDVAVVGGGITGLTCALILGEAGKRVALLERREVGSGVTGSTTAHLTEVLDTRYHELESRFGREQAALARASSRDAIELIAMLAGGASHDCGFRRLDGYLFADKAEQVAELDAELDAARRAGLAAEREDAPPPLRRTSALRFANQAQIQPLAYLAALAHRARRSGTLIFESTGVTSLETEPSLQLQTDTGRSVRCRAVVLATHSQFVSTGLELKLAQYRSYAVAGPSRTVPDALLWDLDDPYHYVRRVMIDGQPYLILGGADHRTGEEPQAGAEAPYRELEEYAARFGATIERRWSAQVVESADGLPFIGRPDRSQEVYVATGFSGNGMTFGTLSAMIIADQLLGRDNQFAELYRADRFKPLAGLANLVKENAGTAVHASLGHLRGVSSEPIQSLAPDTGAIFEHQGQKLAVYRDPRGELHALSAKCTHKGCQVVFNAVERSWDCPCHGSRFDVQGCPLDGPATKALEPRAL